MSVKRLFEDSEYPVRVVGSSKMDAALSQLEKNDDYHAVLIDWDESPDDGLALSCAVKERGEPVVVAYQTHWSRDDVRRALQLGIDCLMVSPFSAGDVIRDIQSVYDDGESLSRRQILDQGGRELLEPDPSLWNEQTEDWRDRMISVADNLSRPWSEDMSDSASHMEVSVRRRAQIDQMSPTMARAVLEVLDQGRDRLPEITARYQIDADELVQVLAAVERFAQKHGGAGRIPLLMDAVLTRDRPIDDEHRSPRLMVLKRVARVVVRVNGKPARRRDPLNETSRKFLGVPEAVMKGLSSKERFSLAVRLLVTEEEADALDQVGFMVLAQLILISRDQPIEPLHLEAMNSLMGFDGRHTGIDHKKLIRKLAVLNPIPTLLDIDLLELERYRDALGKEPEPEFLQLASALEQLIEVARPLGPIDQKRLKDLSHAIRHELPVLVGPPTWLSLKRTFENEPNRPLDQILSRLSFVIGARTERSRELLEKAITDLVDVGRNSIDAARFAELCRQACSSPLSKEVIAEYVGETHDQFTPDKLERHGAAEQRAMVDEALALFSHMEIDEDAVRLALPPAPRGYTPLTDREMTRVRVLAAVLETAEPRHRLMKIQSFLKGNKLHTAELDALEYMMGESDFLNVLRADFHDPLGEWRDGFDWEDDEELNDDFNMDEYDYADEDAGSVLMDEWEQDDPHDEDEDLDSIVGDEISGAFDQGAVPPPPRTSQPPAPKALDLGLDELELELDLSGGAFADDEGWSGGESLSGSLSDSNHSTSARPKSMSSRPGKGGSRRSASARNSDWRESSGDSVGGDLQQNQDNFDLDTSVSGGDSASYGSVRMESDSVGMGPSLSGFDLGPPSEKEIQRKRRRSRSREPEQVPLTFDDRLDLGAIEEMIAQKKLKDAARLLHHADDDLPDLWLGLNVVALNAFEADRHHAAHMLWTRAADIAPSAVNVLYSLARVRVELGKYNEAKPILEQLSRLRPHLSLVDELQETVNHRTGGGS